MYRRRQFLQAAIAGTLGWRSLLPAWAQSGSVMTTLAGVPGLQGNNFDLTVAHARTSIAGKSGNAIQINGQFPAPLLRWREGDELTLNVHNTLEEPTSIHWHGVLLPWQMDGVPGVSFPGIAPNESFAYHFPVKQAGTYWYHSHSGFQEQVGHYGPIIIDPATPEPFSWDREYVVMLSDWTFENPERVFSKLKKMGDAYNYQQRTVGDFFRDVRKSGFDAVLSDRKMWGDMRMNPTDLADVTAATYTYLVNGHGPDENWTGLFQPGERIRLRFINASSMSIFNVRIPGLPMTVVQADGLNVQPVETDEFQIGTAETFDVIVQPQRDEAFTIMAETNDFFGYARATLAPRAGMTATVPALRPRPLLTMKDMGMEHEASTQDSSVAHDHAAASQSDSADMAGMDHSAMNMAGMDHSSMNMAGMEHSAHAAAPSAIAETDVIDHSTHAVADEAVDHSAHAAPAETVDHSAHTAAVDHSSHSASESAASETTQSPTTQPTVDHSAHAATASPDMGPGVTNLAANPVNRLHERPLGLENESHRVLVYTELRSLDPNPDQRAPSRELVLHLTSNMERYMWSFDGVKFSEVTGPIPFVLNERVRLTLINDTMMPHPMHLHGMYFDLVTEESRNKPRKHTLVIKPSEKLSVDLTADAPGEWAFHCHLLYHMHAGMMRVVAVSATEAQS
ncbi:MAG: copper resistance system multicopper oxidase [Pseudomonadota bacterium]